MSNSELTWETILTLASQQDATTEDISAAEDHDIINMNYSKFVNPSSEQWRQGPSYDVRYQTPYVDDRSHLDIWQSSRVEPVSANPGDYRREARSNLGPQRSPFQCAGVRRSSDPHLGTFNSSSPELGRQKNCFYCNKIGHIKRNCRRYLNLCLVCGSADHRLSNCDARRYNRLTHENKLQNEATAHGMGYQGAESKLRKDAGGSSNVGNSAQKSHLDPTRINSPAYRTQVSLN